MRSVISILGVCAALVMCAVSAAMNYLFLSSLGQGSLEGHVLGAASAAADLLKALLPFFIAWSWREKRYVASVTGALAFSFFAVFALLSALGFAAHNRGVVSELQENKADAYERVQRDLDRAVKALSALPAHRPASVVSEEVERHRQNRRWITTSECTAATEGQSREYCAAYFSLKAELAAGEEAKRLNASIDQLQADAQRLRDNGAKQENDPQVSLVSRLLSVQPDTVRLGLILVVGLLVEIGASLGLYLASGHEKMASQTPSRPKGSVEDFCLEALTQGDGNALEAATLRTAYRAWCLGNGLEPLSDAAFDETFAAITKAVGIASGNDGYCGIALKAA